MKVLTPYIEKAKTVIKSFTRRFWLNRVYYNKQEDRGHKIEAPPSSARQISPAGGLELRTKVDSRAFLPGTVNEDNIVYVDNTLLIKFGRVPMRNEVKVIANYFAEFLSKYSKADCTVSEDSRYEKERYYVGEFRIMPLSGFHVLNEDNNSVEITSEGSERSADVLDKFAKVLKEERREVSSKNTKI